jgi:hypothetical protein
MTETTTRLFRFKNYAQADFEIRYWLSVLCSRVN